MRTIACVRGYWAGCLTMWAGTSLAQDLVGKNAYIQYCQDRWISGYITVPLMLVVLAFAAWLYLTAEKVKTDEKK